MISLAPLPALRCEQADAVALHAAVLWICRLNGTRHPKGQDQLRAEVAQAENALARIRAAIPAVPQPQETLT